MDGMSNLIELAAAGGVNMDGIVTEARQLATAVESRLKREGDSTPVMLAIVEVVRLAREACGAAAPSPAEPAPAVVEGEISPGPEAKPAVAEATSDAPDDATDVELAPVNGTPLGAPTL